MMIFTFSPPEDWKQGKYGTDSILPPNVIKAGKLAARGMCLALLTLSTFSVLRNRDGGRKLLVFSPLVLFTAWIICSTFWSPLKSISLQQAGSFFIVVMFAFVCSMRCKTEKSISVLLFNATFVLMLLSAGLLVLRFAAPQYGALTKVSSGLFHSTTAGSSASLGIILTLGCLIVFRWRWCIWLIVPALMFEVPVLILAGNRMSILLTIVAAVFLVVFFSRKQEVALLGVVAAALGLIYLVVDPRIGALDPVTKRVEKYSKQGQTTAQLKTISGRTEMWSKMISSFKKSPWIGHGHFVTSETGRINVWGEWGNWTAHNMYLQILVTTGIIGALLFSGVALVPLVLLFRCYGKPRVRFFLGTIGFWFAGWGILNSTIVGPIQPESVVFGLIYGISIAFALAEESSPQTTTTPNSIAANPSDPDQRSLACI